MWVLRKHFTKMSYRNDSIAFRMLHGKTIYYSDIKRRFYNEKNETNYCASFINLQSSNQLIGHKILH